jgi:hypothetical protein
VGVGDNFGVFSSPLLCEKLLPGETCCYTGYILLAHNDISWVSHFGGGGSRVFVFLSVFKLDVFFLPEKQFK